MNDKPILTIKELQHKIVVMDDTSLINIAEKARFPNRSALPPRSLRIAMINSITEGFKSFDPILLNRIHEAIR